LKSLALLQTADMTRLRRIESGPTFIPVPTGKLAGACEHAAQWLRASVSRETERAEPRPELVYQE